MGTDIDKTKENVRTLKTENFKFSVLENTFVPQKKPQHLI